LILHPWNYHYYYYYLNSIGKKGGEGDCDPFNCIIFKIFSMALKKAKFGQCLVPPNNSNIQQLPTTKMRVHFECWWVHILHSFVFFCHQRRLLTLPLTTPHPFPLSCPNIDLEPKINRITTMTHLDSPTLKWWDLHSKKNFHQ
jgi:hypothetical protein